MTYAEAAKLVAQHAMLVSQYQKMKDAMADALAAQERSLQNLEPLMRTARSVMADYCREAEERARVVPLRPSIRVPGEQER